MAENASILKWRRLITVPQQVDRVKPADLFVRGGGIFGKHKVGRVGEEFKERFLRNGGKQVKSRGKTLSVYNLRVPSRDHSIVQAFPDPTSAEVNLLEVFLMTILTLEWDKKKESMFTRRRGDMRYLYYVKDLDGSLCAVSVGYMGMNLWRFEANGLECPLRWGEVKEKRWPAQKILIFSGSHTEEGFQCLTQLAQDSYE